MSVIDIGQVRAAHTAFLFKFERMVEDVAQEAANRGVELAQRGTSGVATWKYQSGRLAKSIQGRVLRGGGGKIVRLLATAKHARYIEEGTSPHVIEGSPLKMSIGGTVIFRRRALHPGNRAYWFLRGAHQKAGLFALTELRRRMAELASKF